jgi:DNA polymerase-4
MDAFYASVEQRDEPGLRGRPVLVGSDRPRGVVCAASYEARKFGCRSAQPMAVALRLCPDAVVVHPRMERYAAVSEQVFAVLEAASPLVEPLSVDEAFLEATGTERLHGPAEALAARLKERIRAETGLTASVGVAANKFLAKIASDLRKPDGLVSVPPGGEEAFLAPLPVERLWGVGPVTAGRLHGLGVRTVADLRAWSEERLAAEFGAGGPRFHRLSRGIDDRPVVPESRAKSLGREHTFEIDCPDPGEVRALLLAQAEAVGRRLRKHGLRAAGVAVKIRYGDFETIGRQATLAAPTDATLPLRDGAAALFDHWAGASFRPVRLIGVVATRLEGGPEQGELFPDTDALRKRRLDSALDEIAGRFGATVLRRGLLPTPGAGLGDPRPDGDGEGAR